MSQRVLVIIGQLILINILYLFINVVSVGLCIIPSTSTLFYFIKQIKRKEDDPYGMFTQFFKKIKTFSKGILPIQILITVIGWMIVFNYENFALLNYAPFIKQTLIFLYIVLCFELILFISVFSYLRGNYRFNSNQDSIKMTIFIIHKHGIVSLIVLSIYVLIGYGLFVSSVYIALILAPIMGYGLDFIYKPIAIKYIKEVRETDEPNRNETEN